MRPKGWNEIAEAEIKRLNDPLPQSERTYLEAGAQLMLEGLRGNCEYATYITVDEVKWIQIPKLTGSRGWLVFIPEEE